MKKIKLYYLIESSFAMQGSRIGTINASMEECLPMLKEVEKDTGAEILIRAMSYGSWAKWCENKPVSLDEFLWEDIYAEGESEFGAALNLLGAELSTVSDNCFTVIVHIACSNSSDDYESVLNKLNEIKAYKDALRICVNIEEGYSRENAYKFTRSFNRVISAKDSALLKHFIKSGAEDFFHSNSEKDLVYTEKNHPGRDKCDQLRDIRKRIATANNIDFEPAECHHTGPCRGTCPVCDSEIKYLDEQLQEKKRRGEEICLTGIAEGEIRKSKVEIPEDDKYITMGTPVIDGGLDTIDIDEQIPEGSGNDDWGGWD